MVVLNWLACVSVSVLKGKAMEPMSVNDMVADARTRIQGLSMEEMQRELEEGKAIIVDIRDVRERWRDGTIPGSKHVTRGKKPVAPGRKCLFPASYARDKERQLHILKQIYKPIHMDGLVNLF